MIAVRGDENVALGRVMTAQHFECATMFTFKFFKSEFHIISISSQIQKIF